MKTKTTEQYRIEQETQNRKDLRRLEKFVEKVPVPTGWSTDWTQRGGDPTDKDFTLRSPEGDIELVLHRWGSGTTRFRQADGWRSYDRTGVEDSFYWREHDYSGGKTKEVRVDMAAVIKAQLERIAKSREFYQTALKVPGIGFSVSPEGLKQLKRELKSKGTIFFQPSGFGTGYRIVTRKPNHRFGVKRASAEMEKFFDYVPLWVMNVDCD